MMATGNNGFRKDVMALFKAWCARHGYKPVRMEDGLKEVGEALVYIRPGERMYSVEVAGPPVPGSSAAFRYEYPLLEVPEAQALAFLKT